MTVTDDSICSACGGPCDAVDAVALDSGLAFCGSVYGNGCADKARNLVPNDHELGWELYDTNGPRRYKMTFGLYSGEPCAAVVEEHSRTVHHIPRDVLIIASKHGWQ